MQQSLQNVQSSSSKQQSTDKQLYEGRWTPQEHIEFLKAVLVHGKDWKKVQEVIQSRTGSQVRSHAQKFFLKISKINKERRRHKNKPFQLSETQAQILNLFTEQDITQSSPSEIVSIIRKEFNTAATKIVRNILKQSNKGKQMQHKRKISEEAPQKFKIEAEDVSKICRPQKQSGQFTRILQNLKNNEDYRSQDQSFFITLFKRNMEHFRKGGEFSDLIDFGKNVMENEQTSPRKPSGLEGHDPQSMK